MFRKLVLIYGLLSLAGCLDLGGGGGGGGSSNPAPPATSPPETPSQPPAGGGGATPDPETPETPQPPVTPPVTPPTEPPVTQPENRFPEPSAAVVDEVGALGFYDQTADGQPRPVRNDLTGTLAAMLQFVQSHSVDPQGNEAKNMPRLTSEREALLLVTPDPDQPLPRSLRVQVLVDGALKGDLTLRHPDELFRADRTGSDARPDVVYSRRAWSAVLPWDWVVPGMSLQLSDDQGRSGQRGAEAFDFAPPAELLVQAIRIGMLTPEVPGGQHWFNTQPAQAATDYFQTVPIARMVASRYEDVLLRKVMVANGTIYDADQGQASATTGDVYSGDMRENTAKSTFSTGINLANWGITSAGMASQEQPQLTNSAVIHHARGQYANGPVNHGLSGGNGILTLIDSVGNEFSHEIGHHYGLGHYPGQSGDNYFWSGHHHDSGWGYIAYRKRMRANLHWTRAKTGGLNGMPIYADAYSFATDAMAGGNFASGLSRYTHYTGYSTRQKIQPALNRAVWAPDSPTGYRKWDATSRKMEVFQPKTPTSRTVWYNSADGNYRKPRLFGVPVITLLGGYDPETGAAVLYPALRGNWGQVYDLPPPDAAATSRQCWLEVSFVNDRTQRIAVAPTRLGSNANKLHVNLAQVEQPVAAALQCRDTAGAATTELASVVIPQGQPALPPPVIVGREAGFQALRQEELPQLDAALTALAGQLVPTLKGNARVLFDSYSDQPDGLSATAQQVRQRLLDQQARALRLNRWLDAYGAQLAGSADAGQALDALLATLQFDSRTLLPPRQGFAMGNGNCVRVEQVDGAWQPYVLAKAQCTGSAEEQWRVDASGRIRSVAQPTQCLTASNDVGLSACDSQQDAQAWDFSALPQLKAGSRCLDLSGGYLTNGRGKLILYGCTGGANQKWYGPTLSDNGLLPLLQSRNIAAFTAYAEQRAQAVAP